MCAMRENTSLAPRVGRWRLLRETAKGEKNTTLLIMPLMITVQRPVLCEDVLVGACTP